MDDMKMKKSDVIGPDCNHSTRPFTAAEHGCPLDHCRHGSHGRCPACDSYKADSVRWDGLSEEDRTRLAAELEQRLGDLALEQVNNMVFDGGEFSGPAMRGDAELLAAQIGEPMGFGPGLHDVYQEWVWRDRSEECPLCGDDHGYQDCPVHLRHG